MPSTQTKAITQRSRQDALPWLLHLPSTWISTYVSSPTVLNLIYPEGQILKKKNHSLLSHCYLSCHLLILTASMFLITGVKKEKKMILMTIFNTWLSFRFHQTFPGASHITANFKFSEFPKSLLWLELIILALGLCLIVCLDVWVSSLKS